MFAEKVAALFVASGGCYFDLPNVIPWPVQRDARTYRGPWPVVAHPPCDTWGKYWPRTTAAYKGDDGGCFASALHAVNRYGGVLEHPEGSGAFERWGIPSHFLRDRGWEPVPGWGPFAWVCRVEQGHYGHAARKPTILYAISRRRPLALEGGPSNASVPLENLSKRERAATPPLFRDALLSIARESDVR